jgi:bacteriocin-like protein
MSFEKYLERFRHIDYLIRRKATGDIECFSKKLQLSRSTSLEYLKEMKELGFPIKYSKERKSYYYDEDGKMTDHLFLKTISDEDLKKITGGKSFFYLFSKSGNTGP